MKSFLIHTKQDKSLGFKHTLNTKKPKKLLLAFLFKFNIVILQYIIIKMGITKTQIFTEKQNDLAQFFKVLGHPARVAILQYISNQNACICNDLVEEIGLAQATISQHLKELKNIGLIQGEVEGKSMCYCINVKRWNAIQNQLNLFFNTTKANCC